MADPAKSTYYNAAMKIQQSLSTSTYLGNPLSTDGILLHGTYSYPVSANVDTSLIWGDYYFVQSCYRAMTPPAEAAGLSAGTTSYNQVPLSWQAQTGAIRYNVKRSTVSGGPYTTIAPPPVLTTNSYTDTGVQPSTTYYYVVSASNVAGEGPNSAEVAATTLATPPDFSLSASPGSLTLSQSGTATSAITMGAKGGFSGTVNLSASGVAGGPVGALNPAAIAGSGTSVLTVTASGVTAGTYSLTITGTSGTLVHSASVSVTVTPRFTFSLSAASPSVSLAQGKSATDSITAKLLTGSSAPVTLSTTSTLPAGAGVTFSGSCTPTCTTTMTISTSSSTPAGSYSIVVTGSGPGASASTTVGLTVTTGGSTADITTGLAAQWKFTEGSGNYAYDSSGFGNTATLYNPTWWTSNYGMAISFSGSNSYGSVNESKSIEMTSALTVAFWVRASANAASDPRIVTKLYDWDVKLNGTNRTPQFSSGSLYAQLNYVLPLTAWHHVVFTFNQGVVTGYVDGASVPFKANTFTVANATLPSYAYKLYLAAYDGSGSSPFIGSLDDVRMYNRALSAADVLMLYQALPKLN